MLNCWVIWLRLWNYYNSILRACGLTNKNGFSRRKIDWRNRCWRRPTCLPRWKSSTGTSSFKRRLPSPRCKWSQKRLCLSFYHLCRNGGQRWIAGGHWPKCLLNIQNLWRKVEAATFMLLESITFTSLSAPQFQGRRRRLGSWRGRWTQNFFLIVGNQRKTKN